MQHRDNYFVLYFHRYKEACLTRSCFFLVYMTCFISYKPITNTAWIRARLCKLQKRLHSTRSRTW